MPDVFISYSSVDNSKVHGQERGWIDNFYEALKIKLDQLCGPQVEVWRDHRITGNDILTPTIEEAVRKTRLLVSVLSPSYLQSEWCTKELRFFIEAVEKTGGMRVATKSRLLKVIKTPVDAEAERAALVDISELVGYRFFRKNEEGKLREFDPFLGQEESQEFYRHVIDVAEDIRSLLGALHGSSEQTGTVVPPSGLTVYVAEAGSDLTGEAEALRRELQQFGHKVVPETPYGFGPDYAERARADLARAQLSVHPIGTSQGAMPENEQQRIVALQYALALEEVKRRPEFSVMPWMPPGLSLRDVSDQEFARKLADDGKLLVTSLEDLKTTIHNALTRRPAPKSEPRAAAADAPAAQVYFCYDAQDAAPAKQIADALYARGLEVSLPLFDGDETERREDHEDNLVACDAVLFYHNSATELWLRTKLRDLRKAFGNGRKKPYAARGLMLGDPARVDTSGFLIPDLIVLDGSEPFTPDRLTPFLQALARAQDKAV